MRNRCSECVTNRHFCEKCVENPDLAHHSYFQAYVPACPIGEYGCILDPAYTRLYNPERYKILYGAAEPQEVMKNHPCFNDNGYGCANFDDEDK